MLETLREDFAGLPALLELGPPPQPAAAVTELPDLAEVAPGGQEPHEKADQLGLF